MSSIDHEHNISEKAEVFALDHEECRVLAMALTIALMEMDDHPSFIGDVSKILTKVTHCANLTADDLFARARKYAECYRSSDSSCLAELLEWAEDSADANNESGDKKGERDYLEEGNLPKSGGQLIPPPKRH